MNRVLGESDGMVSFLYLTGKTPLRPRPWTSHAWREIKQTFENRCGQLPVFVVSTGYSPCFVYLVGQVQTKLAADCDLSQSSPFVRRLQYKSGQTSSTIARYSLHTAIDVSILTSCKRCPLRTTSIRDTQRRTWRGACVQGPL